jgi:hypothetical protein
MSVADAPSGDSQAQDPQGDESVDQEAAGGHPGVAEEATTPARDKDIKDLLKDLADGVTTLVRQEIELIKAEVTEKTDAVKEEVQDTITEARLELDVAKAELAKAGKKAGVGAGLFGTAGLLGLGAFGTFTACLVALFALAMPAWMSALLVTLLYGAVGGALAFAGRNQVKQVDLPVPETVKRLGAVLTSGKARVQQEVAPIPKQVVEPLKNVKDEAQQAWQRGGEKP